MSLTTTFGRYQVLEKIGQGGMGVVYRAQDTLLERVVALKVIATTMNDNPELRERFFREARAAGQLSHRNIITIHDLGEHEGQPYLAMECLSGEDLQRRLTRPDVMGLARKLEVAADICDGLAYAHRRGVIHRDIKPANIFITDEGVVKLLDFGLARMVATEVTGSNMMLGTLNYMAPEQVRGERTDHRADIFSFGVVVYEILAGRKAFQGDSYATTLYKILQQVPEPLLSIDPTLPYEAVRIVEKALAKPLDERYQDLTDVGRDLAILRQHLSQSDAPTVSLPASSTYRVRADVPAVSPSVGYPASPSDLTVLQPSESPVQPPPASRRGRVLAAVVAVVAALTGAAWFTWRQPSVPESTVAQTPAPPVSGSAAQPAPPSAPSPPPAATEPAAAPSATTPPPGDRTSIDHARDQMTRARSAARQAGPNALRSPAYAAALAAEREGMRLLRAGKTAEASGKFYQASGLFHSAELSAAAAASPEPSRTELQAPASPAPAPSAPAAPTPSVPVPEPPAQQPPAPTPPPLAPVTRERPASTPPPAPIETPTPASGEDGVRDLLRHYEQALETRNVDALKRVWPALGGAQEDAIRKEFAYARQIEVTIDNAEIAVSGASATATFIRRYQLSTVDGQKLLTNSRTTMSVRRVGSDWIIDRVRFEAVR